MELQLPRPQRVSVVVNPVRAGSRVRDAVVIACRRAGWPDPVFHETTVEDPGQGAALAALEREADVVLAAGGDGTIRWVAETLSGTGVPLGVIPLGTGNLLARNLGAALDDPMRSVEVALFGDLKSVDMARMRLEDEHGGTSEHQFCVISGAGFDAQIMDADDALKKRVGWAAYGASAARHLVSPPRWARFSVDGGPWTARQVRSIMVANCGLLTGGIELVPGARLDDGLLDLVVMSPRTPTGWAVMAAKVALRHQQNLPVMETHRGRKVRAEFWEPIESQLDGDPSGKVTAFETEVLPGALKVRVPPSQADDMAERALTTES